MRIVSRTMRLLVLNTRLKFIKCAVYLLISGFVGYYSLVFIMSHFIYKVYGTIPIGNYKDTKVPLYEPNESDFFEQYDEECTLKNSYIAISPRKAVCPCISPQLIGWQSVDPFLSKVPDLSDLQKANPAVQTGGHFSPSDCHPRQVVAVVIPFRGRQEHLQILLERLHPMLQRQLLDYTIFVVEQEGDGLFNKALLMNAGYLQALNKTAFSCFVFHDVDMIPEDDRNFYACSAQPRHVASHCNKFGYREPNEGNILPYGLFGGAISMKTEQFRAANGFSNLYYGWGGEDDEMVFRLRAADLNVVRFPGSIARYTMLKHKRDKLNKDNPDGYRGRWRYRPEQYQKDGLNSIRYKFVHWKTLPLYTHILVNIPQPDTLPTPIGGALKLFFLKVFGYIGF